MIEFLKSLFEAIITMLRENGAPTKTFDVDLIKKWEGLRLAAYQDTGGVWTIGYGHTHTAKPGMVITKEEAERLLWVDVKWAKDAVERYVHVPLTHGQKSALVSFTYNVGVSAFRKSTLLMKLNAGDYAGASDQFMRWVYDNGKRIQGLANRRKDEKRVFDDG